jgi:2-C-methyl-D-erythritol 2,4-cyclodiphosphate synthase
LIAHSDGDVIIHAVSDAILGAMGLGDIGRHFPDTDAQYKDIRSIEILKKVVLIMKENGFSINNVDTVLLAEEPKISPFKNDMIRIISSALGVDEKKVNIKATTSEGVGAIGRLEAVAAYAVVSLREKA